MTFFYISWHRTLNALNTEYLKNLEHCNEQKVANSLIEFMKKSLSIRMAGKQHILETYKYKN